MLKFRTYFIEEKKDAKNDWDLSARLFLEQDNLLANASVRGKQTKFSYQNSMQYRKSSGSFIPLPGTLVQSEYYTEWEKRCLKFERQPPRRNP
jgi:hypothetical protein